MMKQPFRGQYRSDFAFRQALNQWNRQRLRQGVPRSHLIEEQEERERRKRERELASPSQNKVLTM